MSGLASQKEHLILCIDGHAGDFKQVKGYLETEGYIVRAAKNGEAGLKIAAKHKPDLLLLDAHPPGNDGLEVYRMLKANADTSDIPVIFLSEEDNIHERVKAFKLGALDYISKPFRVEEILSRVNTVIRLKHLDELNVEYLSFMMEDRSLSSLGTLAYGIAHNYNNLLGVILARLQMIQGRAEPESKINRDVKKAIEATRRMADMCNLLLFYARGHQGEHKPVDLVGVIAVCMEMFAKSIPEGVNLRWHSDLHECIVSGVHHHLERAVLNILANAGEAVAGNGDIDVLLALKALPHRLIAGIDSEPARSYACISVIDDGTGMSPELVKQAVTPFYTTKKTVGVGLGLSAVQGIVKAHDGVVDIQSEPGKGTGVSLYIPYL